MHTWLAEAVRLDATSRAGNLAFISLLGGCDPGKIIEQGEAFMPNLRDPALRAKLHFALGDAHADSVGLSGQADHDSAKQANVQDAPTPLAEAMEHYRAGLAIDGSSALARAAWNKVWRLLAGLPPLVHFHCDVD
jgi:hypothetical protein